jgi:hypothetical protein
MLDARTQLRDAGGAVVKYERHTAASILGVEMAKDNVENPVHTPKFANSDLRGMEGIEYNGTDSFAPGCG